MKTQFYLLGFIVFLSNCCEGDVINKNATNTADLHQHVKYCLGNASIDATFDILLDLAVDPLKSPFYQPPSRSDVPFLGRIVNGRFVSTDPMMLFEHISLFIADLESGMNRVDRLNVGIVATNEEVGKIYYLNASSTYLFDKPAATTTTPAAPTTTAHKPIDNILSAFVDFSNRVAGILTDAVSEALISTKTPTSIVDDDNWPPANVTVRLAKLTRKVLEARSRNYALRLPESKSNRPRFTLVITDGQQKTPASVYPNAADTFIFDLGGYWSAVTKDYTEHNVLTMEFPQDLVAYVHPVRLWMCQSLNKFYKID